MIVFYLLEQDAGGAEVFVKGTVVDVSIGGEVEVEGDWRMGRLLAYGGLAGMGLFFIASGISHFAEFILLGRGCLGYIFFGQCSPHFILKGAIINTSSILLFSIFPKFVCPGGA